LGESGVFAIEAGVWLLTANVLLLGAVVLLYAMKWRGLMDWTFSYAIKPTHWVQAMAQGSLYVYWSRYSQTSPNVTCGRYTPYSFNTKTFSKRYYWTYQSKHPF
jgi:hypothetical protein